MGSGKTSVGRRLANELNLDFIDSDHEIERRTGTTIPIIFDVEGEAGFRKREAAVIDELTARNNIVLATGGGAVLRSENRDRLKARGTVVYLSATAEELYERTARDRNRPLLQTEDPRSKIVELLQERDPLYREIADFSVSTGRQNIQKVVSEIIIALRDRDNH
jgi:shikimate kinase